MKACPFQTMFTRLGILFGVAGLILAVTAAPAPAVNPGEASYTAEGVAAYRAIASLDPDQKIRNPDYMAAKLVSPQYWRVSIFSFDYAADKKLIEKYRIGLYYYVNARTHHIDGTLRGLAGGDVQQVVNLGAGYDSRAYRLGDQVPSATFFELDLPATIAAKKRRVRAMLGNLPENTVYVPIDFNTQTLEDALVNAGYNPELKTFFIWEGVTCYISEAAVDGTLRFVAAAKPGSGLIFDYMYREVAEGDYRRYPDARKPARHVARMGEPFVFGIEEGDAARFVGQRGLVLRSDLGYRDLERAYLIRSDGTLDGHSASYFRLAYADRCKLGFFCPGACRRSVCRLEKTARP